MLPVAAGFALGDEPRQPPSRSQVGELVPRFPFRRSRRLHLGVDRRGSLTSTTRAAAPARIEVLEWRAYDQSRSKPTAVRRPRVPGARGTRHRNRARPTRARRCPASTSRRLTRSLARAPERGAVRPCVARHVCSDVAERLVSSFDARETHVNREALASFDSPEAPGRERAARGEPTARPAPLEAGHPLLAPPSSPLWRSLGLGELIEDVRDEARPEVRVRVVPGVELDVPDIGAVRGALGSRARGAIGGSAPSPPRSGMTSRSPSRRTTRSTAAARLTGGDHVRKRRRVASRCRADPRHRRRRGRRQVAERGGSTSSQRRAVPSSLAVARSVRPG